MGFYVGRDKYGSNVIVDLDRRADDKTNASALILGNSGQGKTYLLRLLLCNVLEAGKCAISLDSEHEMEDLCRNLGGCFLDFMDGRHRINLLEPRRWDDVVSLMIQTLLLPSTALSWPSISHSFVTSSVSIRTSMSPTLTLWS